ncbi:DUF29 domain-containing protein [Thiocapsa sp.]|uniref:DUF29 domain-containing protein n=1 Tax=Thiocapsa sp. TaxID=2024551 RepID=UPI0035938734
MTSPTDGYAEYDGDFYAWTLQTAQRLRSGCIDQVDLAQVAEEIEDMGKSDRRALESHLKILMLHLLKWRYQPSHRGISWRLSIANARDEISAILRDSPSLRPRLPELAASRYEGARKQAMLETGLAPSILPETCPFSVEQLLQEDDLPV